MLLLLVLVSAVSKSVKLMGRMPLVGRLAPGRNVQRNEGSELLGFLLPQRLEARPGIRTLLRERMVSGRFADQTHRDSPRSDMKI